MKPNLLLLGSLMLLVMVFLSGVIITANVIAEPEPHKFANINTPDLWTSKPKEVDPAKQTYERLPDAPQPQTQVAANGPQKPAAAANQAAPQTASDLPENPSLNSAVDHTMTASIPAPGMQSQPVDLPQPGNAAQPQKAAVDAAQAQFCYGRYRSYRVEDNSYQPFDGGPRRQCQAPGMTLVEATTSAPQRPAAGDIAAARVVAASGVRGQPARAQNALKELPPLPPEAMPTDGEWQAIERGHGDPQIIESAAPGSSEAGSHEAWCANRYRSYRSGDNSYQPSDGSPRRSCQSPFG